MHSHSTHRTRRLRPATKSLLALAGACAFLAALFWLRSPRLLAQDGDPTLPDAGQPRLYLPAIQGGVGAEAGAVIPGEFIVVLQDAEVRAAQGKARRQPAWPRA